MKKSPSLHLAARVILASLLLIIGIFLAVFATSNLSARPRPKLRANNRPALAVPQTFNGTYDATSVFPCATPRHHFTVPAGQFRLIFYFPPNLQTYYMEMTLFFASHHNTRPSDPADT